jgi:hypothetical protein
MGDDNAHHRAPPMTCTQPNDALRVYMQVTHRPTQNGGASLALSVEKPPSDAPAMHCADGGDAMRQTHSHHHVTAIGITKGPHCLRIEAP